VRRCVIGGTGALSLVVRVDVFQNPPGTYRVSRVSGGNPSPVPPPPPSRPGRACDLSRARVVQRERLSTHRFCVDLCDHEQRKREREREISLIVARKWIRDPLSGLRLRARARARLIARMAGR